MIPTQNYRAGVDIGISAKYNFEDSFTIQRYATHCCALGQLGIPDNATKEVIEEYINEIKKESENIDGMGMSMWKGQRALFVTALSTETNLIKILEELEFKKIYEFERRMCYNQNSKIYMYILSW